MAGKDWRLWKGLIIGAVAVTLLLASLGVAALAWDRRFSSGGPADKTTTGSVGGSRPANPPALSRGIGRGAQIGPLPVTLRAMCHRRRPRRTSPSSRNPGWQ